MQQQCPICGNPYLKAVPTKCGGMEYVHQTTDTFQSSCLQSSAAAALKKAETIKPKPGDPGEDDWLSSIPLRRDIEETTVPGDWFSPVILPHGSSIAIAMLNYGSTHAESWQHSPDLRPDFKLAAEQVVLAVLPPSVTGGPNAVIIGKIENLIPVEGESVDVTLAPLACRGPVAEHTGQPLGQPVIVNDFEIYRVLNAAYWFGGKGEVADVPESR